MLSSKGRKEGDAGSKRRLERKEDSFGKAEEPLGMGWIPSGIGPTCSIIRGRDGQRGCPLSQCG